MFHEEEQKVKEQRGWNREENRHYEVERRQ
jgi:hypothetical protein